MSEIITILSLAAVGVVAAGFLSGGAKNKKTALIWGNLCIVVSALAGVTIFFCENAIKEIFLKKNIAPFLISR